MFTIGCHLSASKGYLAMAKQAVSIHFNFLQEIQEVEKQKK